MRNIIVGGISSDLGRVLSRGLARIPERVIVGTTRQDSDSQLGLPPGIRIISNCDLTVDSDCNMLAEVASRFDGPFGYIHSVGNFWEHVPFGEWDSERAAEMWDSHVHTLYVVMQKLIPVMIAKGGGSTIAFSCNSVRYNYPWMTAFTAAKSAVDCLVRSLANEFAEHNLRFNSLVLSSLQTSKVADSKPNGDVDNFAPPHDLLPTIEFLMSSGAYLVNGNNISLFKFSHSFFHSSYFSRVAK
jgi:NAD(P)-dependent dehydrogenase (short-subunit alcohol dehydrogenase family)